MQAQNPSVEDQMMQWITSKWITKPIHVVVELGIADLLRHAPLSVEDLASKTGTHAPTLYRLLRALSSVGIFAETDNATFAMTPLSQCLLSDAMGPLARMFLSPWHDKAWDGLVHSIRTGEPGFDHAFGKQAFKWMEENPQERSVFDQGQGMKAIGFAQAVMAAYGFSDIASICDVGGGQGVFLIQLLTQFQHLKGIVADLPGSITAAEDAIANAGLDTRCKAIPFDFFTETPPLCDAYFLVNVLHDWDDSRCRQILKNIAQGMRADTKLLIIEYLLEPGPGFSIAKLLDLEVLVMGGGCERTLDAYRTLLDAAGLSVSQVISTNQGPALLECRRQ